MQLAKSFTTDSSTLDDHPLIMKLSSPSIFCVYQPMGFFYNFTKDFITGLTKGCIYWSYSAEEEAILNWYQLTKPKNVLVS